FESTDEQVFTYLRAQATAAFTNTYKILRTRIDRFGLASPTINPDAAKGIITIELAGINDPERVRHYLQSTANLQFFEVYNINDVGEGILSAEKSLADYLKGTSSSDTSKQVSDTAKKVVDTANKNTAGTANQADTNAIAGFNNAQTAKPVTGAATGSNVDSMAIMR